MARIGRVVTEGCVRRNSTLTVVTIMRMRKTWSSFIISNGWCQSTLRIPDS